jgi:hypothetical protein
MVTGTLTVEQIHYELGLICENLVDGYRISQPKFKEFRDLTSLQRLLDLDDEKHRGR